MNTLKSVMSFALPALLAMLLAAPAQIEAFSFRETEEREQQAAERAVEERARRVEQLLSVPCDERLKKRKMALIIGQHVEEHGLVYQPDKYGAVYQEINGRLRELGLNTYSQEQIRAQIANEEVRAFLNNEVDAAETAARRLSARYILRGMIRSKVRQNPVVGIDEVFVTMAFTLVDASGRVISNVTAGGDAYSGADPMAVALDIVQREADLAVAEIYHDFCLHGAK